MLDFAKLGGMEPVISLILFRDIQPIFNANLRIPHQGHFGVGSGGYFLIPVKFVKGINLSDLCFSQKPLGKKTSSSLRIQHPLQSTIALVRGKSLGHLGHTWILNHKCHWDDTRWTPTSYKWSSTPMSRVITP